MHGRTGNGSGNGRRELLVRTGVAGAGALTATALGASAVRAAGDEHQLGPVGSWLVTVQSAGSVTVHALAAFTADGVLIESDPVDMKTTAGMGEWQRSPDQTFRITFCKLVGDVEGRLLKVNITATLSLDTENTFSGSGTEIVEQFPGGGVVFQANQTVQGVRIALV